MRFDGSTAVESSNNTDVIQVRKDEDGASIASYQSDYDDHSTDMVLSHGDVEERARFGSIAVTNSKDVHFGNKTYYQGPVTIKQFVVSKDLGPIDSNDNLDLKGILPLEKNNINYGFEPDRIEKNESSIPQQPITHPETSPEQTKQITTGDWKCKKILQKKFLLLAATVILIITIVIITIIMLMDNSKVTSRTIITPSRESQEIRPLPDPNSNFTLPNTLVIKTRYEWLAQPPKDEYTKLPLPVPYVIISHTATENCSVISQCVLQVRLIQNFHIESFSWWDIGYNFLVGGDGYAYEGRGWKAEGAHTKGYNSRAIGISFIGTFTDAAPPERQLLAAQMLIKRGVDEGYIAKDYKLFGAKQLQGTTSPGQALYNLIVKWPHWSPKP